MANHLRILFAVAGLIALVGTVIADNEKTVTTESALQTEEETGELGAEENLGEDADIEEGDSEED